MRLDLLRICGYFQVSSRGQKNKVKNKMVDSMQKENMGVKKVK